MPDNVKGYCMRERVTSDRQVTEVWGQSVRLDLHLLLENKTYAEGARSGAFSSGCEQYSR